MPGVGELFGVGVNPGVGDIDGITDGATPGNPGNDVTGLAITGVGIAGVKFVTPPVPALLPPPPHAAIAADTASATMAERYLIHTGYALDVNNL